jgi:hypothetical protein
LDSIKELIKEGKDEEYIAENFFSKWAVYRRSFQAYAALIQVKRSWKTKCFVIWGKTGTGKTRYCHDQVMSSQFWSPGDFNWFDGYRGQPIVIIDDYRGEYPLQLLLKLLDRYPMQVPIKGGFANWNPRKVYITSNTRPSSWYLNADALSIEAMYRRFDDVTEVWEKLYDDIQ